MCVCVCVRVWMCVSVFLKKVGMKKYSYVASRDPNVSSCLTFLLKPTELSISASSTEDVLYSFNFYI